MWGTSKKFRRRPHLQIAYDATRHWRCPAPYWQIFTCSTVSFLVDDEDDDEIAYFTVR